MPRLKPLCDERSISIVFMDLRYGLSQEAEAAEASASLHANITLMERCLNPLPLQNPNVPCPRSRFRVRF